MTHLNAGHAFILPTHFNLCYLFERIIRSWDAVNIHQIGENSKTGFGLLAERSVRLSGTLEGVLNVRTDSEFLDWLQDVRSDHFLGRYPAEEIFDELVSLFCLYLFHDFWNPDDFRIGPIKPIPSGPKDWPLGCPDCSCAMQVEGHPVELRLWLEKPATFVSPTSPGPL